MHYWQHDGSQSKLFWFYLKIWRFADNPEFCDARLWRVVGSGVQDSRSIKPRFGNNNLLITHVLDSCVKLLSVLHISSAQGRSVHLSVDRNGLKENDRHHLNSWSSVALYL